MTRLTRRAAIGAGFASLAAPRLGHAQDLSHVTLRIGTFKGQDATLLPAAGQGTTPYQVDYHYFNSGQLILEALSAGALDYGSWSEIPTAFAAASNARFKVVAVLQGDVNDQVVLVPKSSAIHGIADLKGKRVGYVRATTSHYYLLKMLWAAGLQFSDIKAINLSPTDGLAAFQAGDLDAWAIYGYPIDFALAAGNARVLLTAQGVLSGNYHIGVAPTVLNDAGLRPAAADYVQRVAKSYAWLEANKTAWSAELAPVIHVPLPFVQAEFDHQSQPDRIIPVNAAAIASAQNVADTFVKAGLLPAQVDVGPYFIT
jgi:sulfonate transport system substrate-binding protein